MPSPLRGANARAWHCLTFSCLGRTSSSSGAARAGAPAHTLHFILRESSLVAKREGKQRDLYAAYIQEVTFRRNRAPDTPESVTAAAYTAGVAREPGSPCPQHLAPTSSRVCKLVPGAQG